jgi:hypothetical protein
MGAVRLELKGYGLSAREAQQQQAGKKERARGRTSGAKARNGVESAAHKGDDSLVFRRLQ